MNSTTYIAEDLVTVKLEGSDRSLVLAWGDRVEVLGYENRKTRIRLSGPGGGTTTGTVQGHLKTQNKGVLQFSLVDVQQGDGMVLETPDGKVILIDGGDNQLFARYVAARFLGSTKDHPFEVDAIVVTHGDADHFAGLTKIRLSETHKTPRKRLFMHPKRVYHNGLVKGPTSMGEEKMLGRTVATRSGRAIIELHDDIRELPDSRLNSPFRSWRTSLRHWAKRGPIDMRRLAFGDKAELKFLEDEGIHVEVLGPIPSRVKVGSKRRPGLPLLHDPPKTVQLPLDPETDGKKRKYSASHTINGHSVALHITYGNVRFFLSGDLNQESMELLRKKVPARRLQCEILKVPHHGSADFDLKALKAFAPVVSLISSGDESSRKEYIHPRATLMGALGQVARGKISLVFCTELAAFFEMRGLSRVVESRKEYFGFERTSFGIIQVRTDGRRVFVFTHSGKGTLKEAYRFRVSKKHEIHFEEVVKR